MEAAIFACIMLASTTEHCPYFQPDYATLLEVHRSKISLHHAKEGYDYPTIRLPHTLSKLAGLPMKIYQTVHDGALAFLVVISSSSPGEEAITKKSENSTATSRYSYLHGGDREFESLRAHLLFSIGRGNDGG